MLTAFFINWVREDFAKEECRTLEEVAQSIYAV